MIICRRIPPAPGDHKCPFAWRSPQTPAMSVHHQLSGTKQHPPLQHTSSGLVREGSSFHTRFKLPGMLCAIKPLVRAG